MTNEETKKLVDLAHRAVDLTSEKHFEEANAMHQVIILLLLKEIDDMQAQFISTLQTALKMLEEAEMRLNLRREIEPKSGRQA